MSLAICRKKMYWCYHFSLVWFFLFVCFSLMRISAIENKLSTTYLGLLGFIFFFTLRGHNAVYKRGLQFLIGTVCLFRFAILSVWCSQKWLCERLHSKIEDSQICNLMNTSLHHTLLIWRMLYSQDNTIFVIKAFSIPPFLM